MRSNKTNGIARKCYKTIKTILSIEMTKPPLVEEFTHLTRQCLVRSSTMQPMRSWHPSGSWHPLQVRTLFARCHMCEEAGGTAVWNTGNQILQRSVGYAACSVRSHLEHFRLHLLEVKMRTFTSFTSVIGSCSKTPLLPTPRCKGGKVGKWW
jgi:hypothetical protein